MLLRAGVIAVMIFSSAAPALAQASSLDKCQKEAANQSAKFVDGVTKSMAKCMQKISGFVIKKDEPIAKAAKSCAGAFRKLENSESPSKTLAEKARLKIRKKCDPTFNSSLGHTTSQVLDLALMPRGLEAVTLNTWCTHFDGDGTIDDVEEWIDCQFSAGLCQARQQLAAEYPRVLEWAETIATEIANLGPDAKYTDAVAALQDLRAALDRFDNDNITINCGPGIDTCGDGIKDGTDDCDGADLGGATCSDVGFQSGTLACGLDCHFDVSGCTTGAFPATGQTISFIAGDDGALELGAAASPNFVDHGDGTISDLRTGLMWEKKSNDGSIHDRDDNYEWAEVKPDFLDVLNTMPCFAGYCDWRAPNVHELGSLINHGANNPCAYPEFDTACPSSCTVLTCSCTLNDPYWTSTTYRADSNQAWAVYFLQGRVVFDGKSTARRVRAVRGGL